MAKFQPGQSGNPAGRPPKAKSLTTMLEKALSRMVDRDGQRIAAKRLMADLVMEAITTGRVKFPGDATASVLDMREWLDFLKWVYQYLEPPITKLEHTGEDGGPIMFKAIKGVSSDDL